MIIKVKFFLLFPLLPFLNAKAQDTISIDTTIHFQTIEGWGHGGGVLGHVDRPFFMLDSSVANPVNYQTLDYLVDNLGLTGSRTWEVGPRSDGTGTDNGDCDSIDWSKFDPTSLPLQEASYLMYFKNRVASKGYAPNFYSSPGYPTHATNQKPWVLYNPGERAQQIWASSLYMKNTYGIEINYDVIYNEPSGIVSPELLADDIKALAPRLLSHGLITRSQFPEAVAPLTAWNIITPVQNDSVLWGNVGRLSYHNYGTADPYRSMIYDFGLSKGITTAQTEMEAPTFDDLYSDLTLANVSYWEVGYSASSTLVPDTGLTSFTPSATFIRLHQLIHYVTPGSVRIGAFSNDSLLRILSFSKNGLVTIVIENINPSAHGVFLSGIPAGTYALSQAAPGAAVFQELGVRTVAAGDTITINANGASSVTTLYPYTGPDHAPTIMTWKTVPGYLIAPSSAATLTATANDAELDTLTDQWTVTGFPAGANPVIATPNALSTSVSGLTVAGTYVFTISVSDGVSTSSKQVYLVKYSTNPQPVLGSAGFRIATPYGLVFSAPGSTTHANIELPLSSLSLQAGISDLANSNFAGRGRWTLVQQPAGANAVVDSTVYIYVSIRANVTGMNVPGDYIFQVNVINPGHPDLTAQIICTVHTASSPPVINSITPAPAVITLPASSTVLTAVTSDPDHDLLRHWWAVVSAPAGAYPQFDYQCKPITGVSGMGIPGTYIFQLRAFDDLHVTTQNISIQVNEITGIENASQNLSDIFVFPNPFTDELHFSLSNTMDARFILYDITCREVAERAFSDPLFLNTKTLDKGIYLYEVRNKNGLIKKGKVIKN